MQIQDLFERDINRSINGVVKADQLDDRSMWQELDEFVVTRELDQHIHRFFDIYAQSIRNPRDPDSINGMGVWVSGFFGSGKSHFIKVLSYVLENRTLTYEDKSQEAVEFFESKVKDAMLMGDIKACVQVPTDVILFNIDSKADSDSREAILRVFLRVFNEMQGYSGDHPHVAHMERHLAQKGKLQQFQDAFKAETGSEWEDERDAYQFYYDDVVKAWSKTLDQSEDAAKKWLDGAEENFALTVENFCKWVREYLDTKGDKHRIVFLVDEIGQFIGRDQHRMLNLQTITENLGTMCEGRAWVVVTSQEDMDAVLGDINPSKSNDYSKIQGRFKTRLSLSSANVDEVIQERLLKKQETAIPELKRIFEDKGDILRNQLSFAESGMTFKDYRDGDCFTMNYPFAPYQFQLLQKIFEAIRKAGATGLHLSRGERSILEAFQSAGRQVAAEDLGILVSLPLFYPAIESFLDTAVKRTIDQAADNASLDAFDVMLLKVLFLIRYVEEMPGTVSNLVTLCIDEVDADRLALRRQIEESLARLERETLVNRNGDRYQFLTNEERDIKREIKQVELSSAKESRILGELIFQDVLKDRRKHRYEPVKKDFTINRSCDQHPFGNHSADGLLVSVITPLNEDYQLYTKERCILESSRDDGVVIFKMPDDETLGREFRTYLKTDIYIRTKNDGTLAHTTRRIIHDLAEENRQRRIRLTHLLERLFKEGTSCIAGQSVDLDGPSATYILEQAMDYLIANTFTKMDYLSHPCDNPMKEIQAVIRSNDINQQTLALQEDTGNKKAVDEVRNYIRLSTSANHTIVMHTLITEHFAVRPYGWAEWETALILARLVILGEISLIKGGAAIDTQHLYNEISSISRWRESSIAMRRTPPTAELQKARNLGKDIFQEMGPDGEDPLVQFLQTRLRDWQDRLNGYRPLADTGKYPGKDIIDDVLTLVRRLLDISDNFTFIEQFNSAKNDLLDASDDLHDLDHFYKSQKQVWENMESSLTTYKQNEFQLDNDEDASSAIQRLNAIREAPAPYGLVQEIPKLIETVSGVNNQLVVEQRQATLESIDRRLAQLDAELEAVGADNDLRQSCRKPLEDLRVQAAGQDSIPILTQVETIASQKLDVAIQQIEESVATEEDGGEEEPPKVKKRRVVKVSRLSSKPYLETADDVNDFVDRLKSELDSAIDNDERIELR